MIHVDFDPATLTEPEATVWREWQTKAEAATRDVLDQWESWLAGDRREEFEPSFNAQIWSDLKAFLLENVFRERCAYCETELTRADYHIDHFRPKKCPMVMPPGAERQQKAECANGAGGRVAHPGYFWLAYAWRNLFPTCVHCNTGRGKKSQFPVRREHVGPFIGRFPDPDELADLEGPLLLDPYRDQPHEHLVFGKLGEIAAVEGSEKGKTTIEVMDLSADSLKRARQGAQEGAYTRFLLALLDAREHAVDPGVVADEFVATLSGKPYSACTRAFIQQQRAAIAPR